MKKTRLLNSELSYEIAKLGHTQSFVVCDCGCPIPPGVKRIDLALTDHVPGMLQTIDAILTELQPEAVTMSEDIQTASPEMLQGILQRFPEAEINYIPHEDFKRQLKDAVFIVRTGEMTLFSNVVIRAGVAFR